VVLHVGRQFRATEKAAVEASVARLSGVQAVEANPVVQTATVTYDPAVVALERLRRRVQECGFDCAGRRATLCMLPLTRRPFA
jgi:Cu2+-exporting ATPase